MNELPERWAPVLREMGETGMGYTVVSVTLKDGRVFPQVVVGSGYVSLVRGYSAVPFDPDDIVEMKATHEKWDWPKPNAY